MSRLFVRQVLRCGDFRTLTGIMRAWETAALLNFETPSFDTEKKAGWSEKSVSGAQD
jgi:hypothetical protein